MSFCRLCGAGFEFVGDHRSDCEVVAPPLVDEEFAQFVFYHFGGFWLRGTAHERDMAKLPKRIADRCAAIAREYELRRGGP